MTKYIPYEDEPTNHVKTNEILMLGIRDCVIVIRGKYTKHYVCFYCGELIEVNYRVTDSWQGWVITCPICGVIKEYDN